MNNLDLRKTNIVNLFLHFLSKPSTMNPEYMILVEVLLMIQDTQSPVTISANKYLVPVKPVWKLGSVVGKEIFARREK